MDEERGYTDCLNDFKRALEKYLNDKTTPDFRIDEVKKEVEYRERYLKEEIPKHLKE